MAEIMRVMNHQAGAPAVRGVGLGDRAYHLEPGVEAKPIATVARRNENARDTGGKERIDDVARYRARLFRRCGAIADHGSQCFYLGENAFAPTGGFTLAVSGHESLSRFLNAVRPAMKNYFSLGTFLLYWTKPTLRLFPQPSDARILHYSTSSGLRYLRIAALSAATYCLV
jgi:hypothetical protein